MILSDFLAAADSGIDLKVLSKMLKELPSEDRRAAGMRFQEARASQVKPVAEPPKSRGWKPTGKYLRSYSVCIGRTRHRVDVYDDALLLHTGWLGKGILITGTNLNIKETDVCES